MVNYFEVSSWIIFEIDKFSKRSRKDDLGTRDETPHENRTGSGRIGLDWTGLDRIGMARNEIEDEEFDRVHTFVILRELRRLAAKWSILSRINPKALCTHFCFKTQFSPEAKFNEPSYYLGNQWVQLRFALSIIEYSIKQLFLDV